uniref:Uncharacterized protein LOC111102869 n=1 Tax=Crassostrea virginica TaxID=6565 RepID=A0A8B8AIY8_CRAVI|nr:uncharacterized protein LOC111102869 [Crassostrea virginica]
MMFHVRLRIVIGCCLFHVQFVESVTKYACVSFSGMGVPAVGGYGGVMGPDWDSSGFNSDSGSSSIEDLGMGFARYGYGMMPPGFPGVGMPPGGVGSVPNMSPGTSPLAAGAMSSPGGAAPGLPNTAASLGGASHITGPGSGPFGQPAGMMPFPPRPPGNAGTILTGSLSCADRPGSTILITKLVYGNGGMYTCSAPDQDCDVVDYRDQEITPFCDGRVRCIIRTTGKMLPACKATSNFVHVEYECIFPWSSFNICKDIKTVVRELEIYVMSPSFFQTKSPPSKTCECILKSRYDNRIMAQYVHTDIHESGNNTCTLSSVLFESKLSPNQTDLEKKTEVCGRRSLNNYLYRGDLRVTFRDTESASSGGFVSKLLVPPVGIGMQNEIAIECGPVRTEGEPTPSPNSFNNPMPFPGAFGPYSPLGTLNSPFQQSPRIPAPPVFEGVPPMQAPGLGPPYPGMNPGPMPWRQQTNWGPPQFQAPTFSMGPSNVATTTTSGPAQAAWTRNEKPPLPSLKIPPLMTATRRQQPTRSRIQSKDIVVETQQSNANNTGRVVAYVIGGIGAVLTAFGAVFISLYCTRRKQRILERKASQRSEIEQEIPTSSAEDVPVYNDPSPSDHIHPSDRENSGGHVNRAFNENETASGEKLSNSAGSFGNLHLHDDENYLTLEEVEEGRRQRTCDLEMMVDPKYCTSGEVVQALSCQRKDGIRRSQQNEENVYDNNI